MSLKKFATLTTLLCLLSLQTENVNALHIVSDVDDTVKITDVPHKLKAAWNGLFSTDFFLGMSELYQEMPKDQLTFLSGSPKQILEDGLQKDLTTARFPTFGLFLRVWFGQEDIKDFKVNRLTELASENRQDNFLLLGDDTEHDPQSYDRFRAAYPERVTKVYIHRVLMGKEQKPLPENMTEFYTAFDIALSEFQEGRLETESVKRVYKAVMGSLVDGEDLFPSTYARCPEGRKLTSYSNLTPELKTLQYRHQERINYYCKLRKIRGYNNF